VSNAPRWLIFQNSVTYSKWLWNNLFGNYMHFRIVWCISMPMHQNMLVNIDSQKSTSHILQSHQLQPWCQTVLNTKAYSQQLSQFYKTADKLTVQCYYRPSCNSPSNQTHITGNLFVKALQWPALKIDSKVCCSWLNHT